MVPTLSGYDAFLDLAENLQALYPYFTPAGNMNSASMGSSNFTPTRNSNFAPRSDSHQRGASWAVSTSASQGQGTEEEDLLFTDESWSV